MFWTKNPEPMLERLRELDGYHSYFQFTLTGYSRKIEPGVPDKKYMLEVFKKLSIMTAPERVVLRYDPIFISQQYSVSYHMKAFSQIVSALEGYTKRCVISFVDIYGKLKPRLEMAGIREPLLEEARNLAVFMAETANAHGIRIETCSERMDLSEYGIRPTRCVDAALIEELTGKSILPDKDPSQRLLCGCCKSVDIGSYHTCKNGCIYCYANYCL